jgi:hypothetical protein
LPFALDPYTVILELWEDLMNSNVFGADFLKTAALPTTKDGHGWVAPWDPVAAALAFDGKAAKFQGAVNIRLIKKAKVHGSIEWPKIQCAHETFFIMQVGNLDPTACIFRLSSTQVVSMRHNCRRIWRKIQMYFN